MIKSEEAKVNKQEGFFRLTVVLSCIVGIVAGPVGIVAISAHMNNPRPISVCILPILCFVATWVIYAYIKWIITGYQNKMKVNKRKGLLGLATILSILAAEAGWIYGEFNDNYTFVFVGVIATWIAYVIARWIIPLIVDCYIVPAMKWVIAGFELDREGMRPKTFDVEKARKL